MFVKICVMLLSVLTSAMTLFNPMPEIEPMQVQQDADFVPVLRFVVSSDSHVEKFGDDGCVKIAKMLKTGYAAAEADENYNKLDAAVMVGDISDFGLPTAFASIKAFVDSVLRDETDFLAVAAKNHDSYLGRISRCYISGISGDTADFHKVINGFHFIGLSASADIFVHYSKQQIKWLDEQLAAAVKDDPSKPVFVFQHEHIKSTVYGSLEEDGWGVDFLTETLSKYPQVIDISGHSHYPANDPRSIWQGEFTAIGDGGLSYYEFTFDGQTSYHPESGDTMAHMLLVEVDGANCVKVRVCDMSANAVLAEYMVDNVAEVNKTKYAHTERKAAAKAPVFNGNVDVRVSGSDVKFTFTPATPGADDVVFIYRFEIIAENGQTVAAGRKIGDYYKNPVPSDIIFTSSGLEEGNYTVKITAADAWGKVSAPLTAEFAI